MKFFGAPNCRGSADTLKLQSKLYNSAAEQTGLRDYMASKVDCIWNAVCDKNKGQPRHRNSLMSRSILRTISTKIEFQNDFEIDLTIFSGIHFESKVKVQP